MSHRSVAGLRSAELHCQVRGPRGPLHVGVVQCCSEVQLAVAGPRGGRKKDMTKSCLQWEPEQGPQWGEGKVQLGPQRGMEPGPCCSGG